MSLGEAIIIMFRLLRGVLRLQVLYTKLVLMRRSVFTYPGRSNYYYVQIIMLSASPSSFVCKTCFNGMDDFYLSWAKQLSICSDIMLSASLSSFVCKTCFYGTGDFYLSWAKQLSICSDITLSTSPSSFVHKTCFNGTGDFYLSRAHTRPITGLSIR